MVFWMPMSPASAAPAVRDEEWWFSTWGIQDRLWPVSTGRGVTVAVLDSGVNAELPDLRGAVLPGYDATAGKGDARTDSDDVNGGHGTGMAALIAGQGRDQRMAGVAPDARILPIRVLHGSDAVGFTSAEAQGIRYATDHGAKVINISVGTPTTSGKYRCMPWLQDAVDYALQHEVLVVTAAGNNGHADNPLEEPASCAGVLAVGAVDNKYKPWFRTGRQDYVAVAAPGVYVGTLLRNGKFDPDLSGTSQASALTSGVAALIRSKFPDMTAREVTRLIINSARDTGKKGADQQTGHGLIRPYLALAPQGVTGTDNPVFSAWDVHMKQDGSGRQNDGKAAPSAAPAAPEPGREHQGTGIGTYLWAVPVVLGGGGLALWGVLRMRRKQAGEVR
ncbi:S8 family peptidase [Actinomadura harenae]|nr:S8 family serine peptidase [Actinomadura harenae]